jgi:hypothetical protein
MTAVDGSRNIFLTHREIIRAPPSAMWAVLVEEMRDPARFATGISDVSIISDKTNFVERKFDVAGAGNVHTFVSADPTILTVIRREHASHAAFAGFGSTTVLPDPNSQDELCGKAADELNEPATCVLDMTMSLTAKPGFPHEALKEARSTMRETVLSSFEAMKKQAEGVGKSHSHG